MSPTRRLLPAAGLALIVLTNAVALGGVAWNRSGEPDSHLALDERELGMSWRSARPDSENSGLSLDLRWRCLPAPMPRRHGIANYDSDAPAWLDATKMGELGFDVHASELAPPFDRSPRRREHLAREVWLVLELDGPAYRQALAERAKEAEAAASQPAPTASERMPQRAPEDVEDHGSRLFAIDAGLDRDALRARHADRTKVAIVRARVSPRLDRDGAIDSGRIDALSIEQVNVPLRLRPVFDGLETEGYTSRPHHRFEATVDFGRRAEPWMADAHALPAGR
jgi:hypothetical protein